MKIEKIIFINKAKINFSLFYLYNINNNNNN